ncbi:unnamed protein product [Boreogadus saida]
MSVRRRSQTQTHLGLTSCPRTRSSRAKRYSHMMMLKTGSLFLILYGLCQIPLAQGQTPRKDETMETTQTWKSRESGAGTEGSQRETQDNPAPTHSGLVNNKGKIVLYAQIPPQNQVKEFVFTVKSDNQPLCALSFRQNYEHAHRKNRCEIHIQLNPMKWCLTVTSGKTWDHNRKYKLNMREYILLKAVSDRTFNFTLEAEDPCVIKNQPGKVVEIDQSNPLKSSDNDKVNVTTATDEVDQPPVRDDGINSLVTTKRLNSTLNASKTNETCDIRDLAQPSVTNVPSINNNNSLNLYSAFLDTQRRLQ